MTKIYCDIADKENYKKKFATNNIVKGFTTNPKLDERLVLSIIRIMLLS